MRLEGDGGWRITLLGARTNNCDGDLWLLTPTTVDQGTLGPPRSAQLLWSGYLEHLGESKLLGPYSAGAELVLGLKPASYCSDATPRLSSSTQARTAVSAIGVWDVWWEDYRQDSQSDYDDLVVRVEAIPLPHQGSAPVPSNAPVAVAPNYADGRRSLPQRRARRSPGGYG